MRIFSGFRVSRQFKEAYSGFQSEHHHLEKIRWTPIEKLHLTMWFYGEVPNEILPNLVALNQVIANQAQAFELPYRKLILAPKKQNARMIWARFNHTEDFSKLFELHQQLIGHLGIVEKEFPTPRPHITLCRFPEGKYGLNDFSLSTESSFSQPSFAFPPTLLVKELVLWESIRSTKGNHYKTLFTIPL